MDLLSIHLNDPHQSPLALRNSFAGKAFYWNLGGLNLSDGKLSDVGICRRASASSYSCRYRSTVVRAKGKRNQENPSSSGNANGGDDSKRSNSSSRGNKSNHKASDWREVRAALVKQEQVEKMEGEGAPHKSRPTGAKWAHPIGAPETGCVLVATEKLDGVQAFERTVVLLLRSGGRDPSEVPFGVVMNRPLPKKIRHAKPTNQELATTFADCSLHLGGPLEASMFLVSTREKVQKLPGFEEVVPGVCFGARSSLEDAAALVREGVVQARDFRFFVGYAGWQVGQLADEIESGYWYVAACSAGLISGNASGPSNLWEEVLHLMGGTYSELLRRRKDDR